MNNTQILKILKNSIVTNIETETSLVKCGSLQKHALLNQIKGITEKIKSLELILEYFEFLLYCQKLKLKVRQKIQSCRNKLIINKGLIKQRIIQKRKKNKTGTEEQKISKKWNKLILRNKKKESNGQPQIKQEQPALNAYKIRRDDQQNQCSFFIIQA
ncbi:unnamed protein product [Paramecium sonneborni]|uniref:Uncharacterized protein n=1 Tax=Paramecium sonneborni TaxID=65129 RepID=A0A8S1MIG1_9CILI|nr:unnamed protein product [Paramecium sonneborni]